MSGFKGALKSGMTEYLTELKSKLEGLTDAELRWQATLDSNSIVWLVWHMAKVEDGWVNNSKSCGASDWDSGGWADQTGISVEGSGYGQTADEVRAMPAVPVAALVECLDASSAGSLKVIDGISD